MNIREEIFQAFTKNLKEKGIPDEVVSRLLPVLKVREVSIETVIAIIEEVSKNAYKD
jgi:hypothetical protein